MARIDHTACTHPRTPAGRAACRKLRAGLATKVVNGEIRDLCSTCGKNVVRVGNVNCWSCNTNASPAPIKMTGPVARRMARQAAASDRIQPRRSGARVFADTSTCVQAALHTSRGLCACGHMTGEFRVAA